MAVDMAADHDWRMPRRQHDRLTAAKDWRFDPVWNGIVSTAMETQVWRPAETGLRTASRRRDEEDARNGEIEVLDRERGMSFVETLSPRRCQRRPRHSQTSTPV